MEVFPKLNQARGIFNIDGVPSSTSNLTQDPRRLKLQSGRSPTGIPCSPQVPSGRTATLKSLNNKDFTGSKKKKKSAKGKKAHLQMSLN